MKLPGVLPNTRVVVIIPLVLFHIFYTSLQTHLGSMWLYASPALSYSLSVSHLSYYISYVDPSFNVLTRGLVLHDVNL